MKIEQKNKSVVEHNFDVSQSTDFGIDKENESIIIDLLRNRLYAHKVRTLIQEYISNARDANREAGSRKRIEVKFPTQENPTFSVRDYGPGLTPDRVGKVFVKYGASTKRATNTQTGGFGIGAKSAWAYTDSFTIRTIVDGVQYIYVAQIADNKNGRLDKISQGPTTEPNGTEISLAAKGQDINAFTKSIYRATVFWDDAELPNFLNSPSPSEFASLRKMVNRKFEGKNFNGFHNHCAHGGLTNIENGDYGIIVIDGIPYENNLIRLSQKCIVKVPNGILNVAVSRELIEDTPENRKNFEIVVKNVNKDLSDFGDKISKMSDLEFIKYEGFDLCGFSFRYQGKWIIDRNFDHNGGFGFQQARSNKKGYNGKYDKKHYDSCVKLGQKAFYAYRHPDAREYLKMALHLNEPCTVFELDFHEQVYVPEIGLHKSVLNEERQKEFVNFLEELGYKEFYAELESIPKKPRAKSQSVVSRPGAAFSSLTQLSRPLRLVDFSQGDEKLGYLFRRKDGLLDGIIEVGDEFQRETFVKHTGSKVYVCSSKKSYDELMGSGRFASLEDLKPTITPRLGDIRAQLPSISVEAAYVNINSGIFSVFKEQSESMALLSNLEYGRRDFALKIVDVSEAAKADPRYELALKGLEFVRQVMSKMPLLSAIKLDRLDGKQLVDLQSYIKQRKDF